MSLADAGPPEEKQSLFDGLPRQRILLHKARRFPAGVEQETAALADRMRGLKIFESAVLIPPRDSGALHPPVFAARLVAAFAARDTAQTVALNWTPAGIAADFAARRIRFLKEHRQ